MTQILLQATLSRFFQAVRVKSFLSDEVVGQGQKLIYLHRSQKGGLSSRVGNNTHADLREFCKIHANFAKCTKIRWLVFVFSLRLRPKKKAVGVEQKITYHIIRRRLGITEMGGVNFSRSALIQCHTGDPTKCSKDPEKIYYLGTNVRPCVLGNKVCAHRKC